MEIDKIENSTCNVLSSGSHGNCEIYFGSVAIDMGVPFTTIKQYVKDLQLVLLSHEHLDHFNISTIKKLSFERPTLRFGCGKWMLPLLSEIKNVDVYDLNKWYDYGSFKLSIGKLYHDKENCFFRLDKNGYKIFRATDTTHMKGITAKNYSLYAIESNYDEDTVYDIIRAKQERGEYAHQLGSINSHLSWQQAQQFIFENAGENYQVLRLHESKTL